ncbi:MAG: AAA family ATPase [Nitrospirae bacterium]|nr:AAA family ATPase [Nitrospirota bacterium]
MYKDFYGLREKPFNKTPDPRFLYLSKAHEEAFARLQYVVEEKETILFTGEIGCGKTTLTRALMDSLNEQYRVILIVNPRLTATQFLRTIARRMDVKPPFNHKDDLLEAIYRKVYEDHENGITPVIIIDEAQLIPKKETFEEIRLLTNFQLDNTNLISLIFVAQPDILRRLKHKAYAPLRQRIGIFYHLPSLSEREVSEYIKHRLKVSGREIPLFTDEATDLIHRYSGGIPRLINSIATSALLDAFSKDSQLVDNTNVMDAVEELGL